MAFMNRNLNFGLMILIIVMAVAIASLGVYYNQNYSSLSSKYNSQLANLNLVTEDLMFHKSRLNQTAADLRIKQQDESELSKRFAQLRDAKEVSDKENEALKRDLLEKSESLLQSLTENAQLKIDNQELKEDADLYETQSRKWKGRYESVCNIVGSQPEVSDLC